ncbi:MAG: SOS response-associated peptidase family protein, partial [Geodermatophilaceae bacterium]|nr:SOS response-associated peptidase family protein [Geodermatophilaceae bacterium]
MCGRYAASNSPDDLEVEFEAILADGAPPVPADYNVAPTDPVYAVRTRKPKDDDQPTYRELSVVSWG